MMSQEGLRTAGKGGPETVACKEFGDDIYEIVCLLRATVANVIELSNRRFEPDRRALGAVLFEACLCRTIDACLTYISSVLQLVYRCQPAALRSKEKVELDYVLQFARMDDLVHALVERKVHALSYRALNDLEEYLLGNLGLRLFSSAEQQTRVARLVDIRNLIVHNRGLVNRIFKERHPDSAEALGDRLRYDANCFHGELLFLTDWIMDLDLRVSEKYNIPTQPRVPRPRVEDVPPSGRLE